MKQPLSFDELKENYSSIRFSCPSSMPYMQQSNTLYYFANELKILWHDRRVMNIFFLPNLFP